jgi:FkbM family methyltransferase
MTDNAFRTAFVARIRQDWWARQEGNFDHYRFPHGIAGPSKWRWYARKFGGERARSVLRTARTIAHASELQWIYDHLADDASRELLVGVLAFRALGSRHVRLPLNGPKFWDAAKAIERELLREKATHRLPSGEQLDDYDLGPAGIPVRMRGHILNVLNAFSLQQYRFERGGTVIEVEPGDTVIDAGGCWGDTALYFALRTGPTGHVYSYEFEAENLKVFGHNMELNPDYSGRIHLVRHPVWSTEGIPLDVTGSGPNTRLTAAKDGKGSVTTDSIDALARRENLRSVDFIKMDIEGAELDALKGAEAAIRAHRPKLAISIYHRLEHYWEIARWIDGLGLGYRFFLEHFTIHAEETMLFAAAPRG